MIQIQSLLNRAFPLMAITGLLLAGWGLIITPDEMKVENPGAHWALWATHATPVSMDSAETLSWSQ